MENVLRAAKRILLRKGWPRTNGAIAGLQIDGDIEVARDEWGIPHITARTMHDAFFAQGYVHAQDRLWQMETLRRVSEGTLSEIVGQSTVAVDWFSRMAGLAGNETPIGGRAFGGGARTLPGVRGRRE